MCSYIKKSGLHPLIRIRPESKPVKYNFEKNFQNIYLNTAKHQLSFLRHNARQLFRQIDVSFALFTMITLKVYVI